MKVSLWWLTVRDPIHDLSASDYTWPEKGSPEGLVLLPFVNTFLLTLPHSFTGVSPCPFCETLVSLPIPQFLSKDVLDCPRHRGSILRLTDTLTCRSLTKSTDVLFWPNVGDHWWILLNMKRRRRDPVTGPVVVVSITTTMFIITNLWLMTRRRNVIIGFIHYG